MPVTYFSDDANGNTVVTVTWSTGELIQYTIAKNPTFNPDSIEDCLEWNVYITGYACPEDDVSFVQLDIGKHRVECAGQFETEADAIEFCSEAN